MKHVPHQGLLGDRKKVKGKLKYRYQCATETEALANNTNFDIDDECWPPMIKYEVIIFAPSTPGLFVHVVYDSSSDGGGRKHLSRIRKAFQYSECVLRRAIHAQTSWWLL
jgi:hypothetical protein